MDSSSKSGIIFSADTLIASSVILFHSLSSQKISMASFKLSDSDLEYLVALADKAGTAIMGIYHNHDAFNMRQAIKIDKSPLTQADLLANQILCDGLKKRWPDTLVLSEEGADYFEVDEEPTNYWAIDPLDGTKEFNNRNGEFTVNIALIYLGSPIFGLVFAPALDSLYIGYAHSKKTSIAKKRSNRHWQKISVSKENLLNIKREVRIASSRSHPSTELESWLEQYPNHKLLEIGSSLKFCYIAEGKVDLYPRLGKTNIWDTAAGHAVVLAAGGVVRDINRSDLSYRKPGLSTNPFFFGRQ